MKTNLLAIALLDSAKRRALKAEAMASENYTDEQLERAHRAMREGTHQFFPAAAHYLAQAEAAWADYSKIMVAMRRHARDRRTGQMELAF